MATFNIKVRLDTSGVTAQARTVREELSKIEQRTARDTRRGATSINSATAALTKFGDAAKRRASVASGALKGVIKRLEMIDLLISRVQPRFNNLLNTGGGRGSERLKDLSASFTQLSRAVTAAEKRLDRLERQMNATQAESRQTSAAVRQVNRTLAQTQRHAATAGRSGARAMRRIKRSADVASISVTRVATGFRLLFGSFVGGLGVVSAGRALAGFEQALSSAAAITKATRSEMAAFRTEAKRLGATTRFTAQQAGEGMIFLARAGLNATQVLRAIEPTLRLAQAGAIDLGRASDIATNIMTAFGLEVTDLSRVIDVMADVATSSNTNISQLGEAMKFVGPVARSTGVDVETAAAAVGVLGNAGLQASLAGTGLRQVLLKLSRQTGPARKALEELGLTSDRFDVTIRGLIPVLESFAEKNIDAGEAARVFENRGGTAFLALLNGLPTLKALDAQLRNAAGAAADMARVMDDNLNGAFLRLGSAAQALLFELSDAGAGAGLRGIVEDLAQLFRDLAKSAELVLELLEFLALTTIGRFILGLARSGSGIRRLLTILFRLGRWFVSIPGAIAAGVAALVTWSDQVVVARTETEKFGELEVTLEDVAVGIWQRGKAAVVAYFEEVRKNRLARGASVPTDTPDRQELLDKLAEQRARRLRLEQEFYEGILGFPEGVPGTSRAAGGGGTITDLGTTGYERVTAAIGGATAGLRDWLAQIGLQPAATRRAKKELDLYIGSWDRFRAAVARNRQQNIRRDLEEYSDDFSRVNVQIQDTIDSLKNENAVLQTTGATRVRLSRQQAAEAQAGIRIAELQNLEEGKLAELRKRIADADANGLDVTAARLRQKEQETIEDIKNLQANLERNKVLRDADAINRTLIQGSREYAEVLLEGTEGIYEATAGWEALALNLDQNVIPAFIKLRAAQLEQIELRKQEQAQFEAIRGPEMQYREAVAALIRILDQGRITFDEYIERLEELRKQYEETDAAARKFRDALQAIEDQRPSESLQILNTGAFGISPNFSGGGPLQGGPDLPGAFGSGFLEQIATMLEGLRSFEVEAGAIFGRIALGLGDKIGTAVIDLLAGVTSLKDAFLSVASAIARELIAAFVKLGIQYLLNKLLADKVIAAATASQAAQAAVLAQAYAPAAAAVNAATFGAGAAAGAASLTAIHALSQALSAIPGLRDGGIVEGPGGSRDDRILARLSKGEFVVNAQATRENRGRLERMNRGEDGESERPINVYMTIQTEDAGSFRRSERQIARDLARGLRLAEEGSF